MRRGQKQTPDHRKKALTALRKGTLIRWNKSPAERFWVKVDRRGPDACWPWTASLQGDYGQIYWGGRPIKAQRASWEVNYGPIPRGQHVLHKCDNPICVNPQHLFLGTHRDNMADMIAKGRDNKRGLVGSQSHKAKLDEQKVALIRQRFSRGERLADLGRAFNVHPRAIRFLVDRKTWKHVE